MRKIMAIAATLGAILTFSSFAASACSNFGSSDCSLNSQNSMGSDPSSSYVDEVYGSEVSGYAPAYRYGSAYDYGVVYSYGPDVSIYVDGGNRYRWRR
jgi:hypothetical protein